MKKLKMFSILFAVSALCLGFVSCGDDDENNESTVDVDYATVISGHWEANTGQESNLELLLGINTMDNTIVLEDLVNEGNVQWGAIAKGSFTLTGNVIKAIYNDVMVFDSDYNFGTYHGFTHGKTRSVAYTIQSCDGKKLVIKDDSGIISTFEKYADIR